MVYQPGKEITDILRKEREGNVYHAQAVALVGRLIERHPDVAGLLHQLFSLHLPHSLNQLYELNIGESEEIWNTMFNWSLKYQGGSHDDDLKALEMGGAVRDRLWHIFLIDNALTSRQIEKVFTADNIDRRYKRSTSFTLIQSMSESAAVDDTAHQSVLHAMIKYFDTNPSDGGWEVANYNSAQENAQIQQRKISLVNEFQKHCSPWSKMCSYGARPLALLSDQYTRERHNPFCAKFWHPQLHAGLQANFAVQRESADISKWKDNILRNLPEVYLAAGVPPEVENNVIYQFRLYISQNPHTEKQRAEIAGVLEHMRDVEEMYYAYCLVSPVGAQNIRRLCMAHQKNPIGYNAKETLKQLDADIRAAIGQDKTIDPMFRNKFKRQTAAIVQGNKDADWKARALPLHHV